MTKEKQLFKLVEQKIWVETNDNTKCGSICEFVSRENSYGGDNYGKNTVEIRYHHCILFDEDICGRERCPECNQMFGEKIK